MVNTNINPSALVRAYVWAVLKANYPEVWHESNYGGLVPIVPLGEEPDLSEYSGPVITYGYTVSKAPGAHFKDYGTFAMTIRDTNFRRMGKTLTILSEALSREDESAADINNFTSRTDAFVGIRFGYLNGLVIGDMEPETTEGGRQEASIVISYECYSEYDVITEV